MNIKQLRKGRRFTSGKLLFLHLLKLNSRKTSVKVSAEIPSNLPESYLDRHEESKVGTRF